MGRFSQVKQRETIHADWWDESEEVIIKRFSWGDKQALTDKTVTVTGLSKHGDTLIEDMSVERTNLAILKAGVESWTFLDDDGNSMPVTEKSFKLLNDDDGEYILRSIDELNPSSSPASIEALESRLAMLKANEDNKEDFLTG